MCFLVWGRPLLGVALMGLRSAYIWVTVKSLVRPDA